MYQLLTVQTFRPDRLLAMTGKFVAMVMGSNFQKAAEQELNLGAVVNEEVVLQYVTYYKSLIIPRSRQAHQYCCVQ